jgi:hypothetical protein
LTLRQGQSSHCPKHIHVKADGKYARFRLEPPDLARFRLRWFPKLKEAFPKQRENWRLVGGGIGLHWRGLDEDISVSALLR